MASTVRISAQLVVDLGLRARPRDQLTDSDMHAYDRRRVTRELRRVRRSPTARSVNWWVQFWMACRMFKVRA